MSPWYVGIVVTPGLEVLTEAPMIGPWQRRSGGAQDSPTDPNDVLYDGSLTTGFDINSQLPEPEVFLNGIFGGLGVSPAAALPATTRVFAKFKLTGDTAAVNVAVGLNTPGGGGSSGSLNKPPLIHPTLGLLYEMDSGGLGQVNNARAGYGVAMAVYISNSNGSRIDSHIARVVEASIIVTTGGTGWSV